MARIPTINIQSAEGNTKQLLESAKQNLGKEINLIGGLANAPIVLESYLNFFGNMNHGVLDTQLKEKIALVSAGFNQCDYCTSAHTYIGKAKGLSDEELNANLKGISSDPKSDVALKFAQKLIETRGNVSEADIKTLQEHGFNLEEIIEILGHVVLNTFSNYFNNAFETDIDFPRVSSRS